MVPVLGLIPILNLIIYFSNYRALEGGIDGVNLQVGEGYSKTVLQSTSTQVNGNLVVE